MKISDYQALFRASPYPYLVMDPQLNIIGASGTYLRSVQRTEEEIVGKYVFDAFPEDPDNPEATNIAEVKASLLRALAKGEPDTSAFVRYAVPIKTANGIKFEERYWSTVHTPVLDDDGKPMFVFQNAIDVTDLYKFDPKANLATLQMPAVENNNTDFNRAQMHEAMSRILSNEREHLRSLFNQAPGFVAVLMGPRHIFEMANEAYYQLVGHREVVGKPVRQALPEVVGQGYEELLDRVYLTGEQCSFRAMPISVQRTPDGLLEQRYIDFVYQPYKDERGTTIGIFTQGYDVTDAVEAQAAQRESEERLRDGMDAAKMVVWDWDLATGSLAYSDNMQRVLGCKPDTMGWIAQFVHPDDVERLRAAHEIAISSTGYYQEIIRFKRPDTNKQIWLDSRGKVRHGPDRTITGIRGVTVDVTDRYQAEFDLREANKRKDEFLAMLAHELRNPLAPIGTAAELLKLVANKDAKVTWASEVIGRQVKHMTALIDDLLDVSRVTRGLVQLENELFDIKTVISSAIEQARPLIEGRRHSLMVRMEPTQAVIRGDRIRLVQVISNLLNNAAKYTPQEGEIQLAVDVVDDQVMINVIDNGMGMEAELLPHVFELFTQAERTPDRSQGGLGIGLAHVKTMVGLHGGKVAAHSVTLPLFSVSLSCGHYAASLV